jgi:hypothetical protein
MASLNPANVQSPMRTDPVAKAQIDRIRNIVLACPNRRAPMAFRGSTQSADFCVFECRSSHCPLKAVILVSHQAVSLAARPESQT